MDIETLREYCLSQKGAAEDFPFDNDTLVFKVRSKIFALIGLKGWESGEQNINLKCDPQKAIELREQYSDAVFPGYHMNKKHWNTVTVTDASLSSSKVKSLINHSYELVVSKLTKKEKETLETL